MEQRAALQFVGFQVNDDPSGKTIISPKTSGDTKNVAGYVGEISLFADNQLRENHVWANGSTIDPRQWPDLATYAATVGWKTDSSTGWYKTPNLQGSFLLPSSSEYAVNTTGGEATHTLTVDEMPAHKHGLSVGYRTLYMSADEGQSRKSGDLITESGSGVKSYTTTSTGSDQPHNNMPPYYVVTAQIRAKVDIIEATAVEVNGNTLGGFTDGQVLAQQGGKIVGQPGALKTYSSVEQLGLTATEVTTKQVFDAMPDNSLFIGFASDVSDLKTWQHILRIEKASKLIGVAHQIGVMGVTDSYLMRTVNSVNGGLSGEWVQQIGDAYKAGDTITLNHSAVVAYVTGGGADLNFQIPLDRPVNATAAAFSGQINVRMSTGQYALNNITIQSTNSAIGPSGVKFTFNPSWNNTPTNNVVLVVQVYAGATITLS